MTDEEIEERIQMEVEARLQIIYQATETHLANRASNEFHIAFNSMSPEASGRHEAYKESIKIVSKEFKMAPAYRLTYKQVLLQRKDEAVDAVVDLFRIRGTRDYYARIGSIVTIIERAQNHLQ
jgi:hypothetical protein